jgi:hypothetical protein
MDGSQTMAVVLSCQTQPVHKYASPWEIASEKYLPSSHVKVDSNLVKLERFEGSLNPKSEYRNRLG